VSVERAARAGVVEAREWQQRAQDRAEREGGVSNEYLADTQPQQFQFVAWPTLDGQPFYPPAEFRRTVQFTEHAPAGGITIGGKAFAGGEFIPIEVMEGATEEERAAIVGKPEPATKSTVVATKRVGKVLRLADGSPLPEHLNKLRVPPAWTNVMVDTNPEAALIISGYDAKGRRQSVYSAAHSARQAGLKFSRIRELKTKLAGIRKQIAASDKPELSDVLELILATGLRPGSTRDTKAAKQAFGATTLEGRHVVVDGTDVRLQFTGKKGVAIDVPVTDESVAAMLLIRKEASGDSGRLFDASDSDLRKFTKTLDGGGFKPKDFRTLKGTSVAATLVRESEPPADEKSYKKHVREVAKRVAAVLGNTPIIALQSYIDPTVFSAWRVAG